MQSTWDLFDLGRLKAGDVLAIRGHENCSARVIDGRIVEYRGEHVSYHEWGRQFAGWKWIQIYNAARISDGRTLDQLRDEPQIRQSSE